ncbi:MAG: hypothetical protein ACFCU6_01485 [Balneolaceae bacterium]
MDKNHKLVIRKLLTATVFLIYFFTVPQSNAQVPHLPTPDPPDIEQSVYLELWGNSGGFTINYDFIINHTGGLRVGLFGFPDRDFSEVTSSGIVMTGNLFYGSDAHMLEMGAGGFLDFRPSRSGTELFMTTTTGYRFHPRSNNFVLRLGFTPAFKGDEFRLQFGLSLGWRIPIDAEY